MSALLNTVKYPPSHFPPFSFHRAPATPAEVLKLLEFCNSCYIATSSDLETSASMVLIHGDIKPRDSRCFYKVVMHYARETVFVGVGFDDYFKYKKKNAISFDKTT
jgi:hypothetical protein